VDGSGAAQYLGQLDDRRRERPGGVRTSVRRSSPSPRGEAVPGRLQVAREWWKGVCCVHTVASGRAFGSISAVRS
jgi:hypothetical protein